jgi:broad specificity phosphatase PhoE
MRSSGPQIVLVRHGETEWSQSGQHTSFTDLPLTPTGEEQATSLSEPLKSWSFQLIHTSPRQRAIRTAELAGFKGRAIEDSDLAEWNYGAYEGMTTAEIRKKDPGWTVFGKTPFGGESAAEVAVRCDRLITKIRATSGDSLLFAHSHVLRVLIARWLELPPEDGKHFVIQTGTMGVLSYEHESPVLLSLNATAFRQGKREDTAVRKKATS